MMRLRTLFQCMTAIAMVCSAAAVQAQPAPARPGPAAPAPSDQETLMQLERDWHKAVLQNDTEFVAGILADEFVATYDDGNRGDKKKELELVAAFNQRIFASALEEFLIQLHRDAAVVHFTLRLLGPVQGEPVEMTLRYIDVWVFRDGRWQCVASQSTRIRPKE